MPVKLTCCPAMVARTLALFAALPPVHSLGHAAPDDQLDATFNQLPSMHSSDSAMPVTDGTLPDA